MKKVEMEKKLSYTTKYISYDIAFHLKKIGFQDPCNYYWLSQGRNKLDIRYHQVAINWNDPKLRAINYSAPSPDQLVKWLEDERLVSVSAYKTKTSYRYAIAAAFGITENGKKVKKSMSFYKSELEALIEGIYYAVKRLNFLMHEVFREKK